MHSSAVVTATPRFVQAAECFIDSDPGEGSGTPLLAFDGGFDEALEVAMGAALPGLPAGAHTLGVRVRDAAGDWGGVFRTTMHSSAVVTATARGVQAAELFWDVDPGLGLGTPALAFDGAFGEALETVVPSLWSGGLSTGPHVLGVRMRDAQGDWSNVFRTVVQVEENTQPIMLAPLLLLEGPYSAVTALMHDSLRTRGLIPLSEPYSALGYAYPGGGGGASIDPAVLVASGSDAVVDWVLVELRQASDPAVILSSCAALLQRDGDVVALDGSSAPTLVAVPGDYHVALRHRNHLAAMTAQPVSLDTLPTTLDLSSPLTSTFGSNARKEVSGRMALWAGDVTFNGQVKYTGSGNDRDPILTRIGGTVPTNVVLGYWREDCTLDGAVKYTGSGNDRDRILQNIGGSVPTAVRNAQLP